MALRVDSNSWARSRAKISMWLAKCHLDVRLHRRSGPFFGKACLSMQLNLTCTINRYAHSVLGQPLISVLILRKWQTIQKKRWWDSVCSQIESTKERSIRILSGCGNRFERQSLPRLRILVYSFWEERIYLKAMFAFSDNCSCQALKDNAQVSQKYTKLIRELNFLL